MNSIPSCILDSFTAGFTKSFEKPGKIIFIAFVDFASDLLNPANTLSRTAVGVAKDIINFNILKTP